MKILHWVVMLTALITSLLLFLPVRILNKVFKNSILVARTASEKCLSKGFNIPID
jgi:uncharacterized membrane protein YjjP (DUF1212 family)